MGFSDCDCPSSAAARRRCAGYDLVRRLGRGSASVVWLARDVTLDRWVALKVLTRPAPSLLARFRREARLVARLECRSIVQVFDMQTGGDAAWIAMEYVDGGDLEQVRLGLSGLAGVIRQVALALGHAHDHGIVHRDIKPANILLDRSGRPYLTDFGLARDLLAPPDATLSTEGQVMGTPAAMPPEQARGALDEVDARSDVYSLGATLYYKLTGRWPFTGDSVIDLLHAVIHEAPLPPRAIAAGVPRSLERIVTRCLAKNRDDRYPSMRELAEDLDRFLVKGSRSWLHRALPDWL